MIAGMQESRIIALIVISWKASQRFYMIVNANFFKVWCGTHGYGDVSRQVAILLTAFSSWACFNFEGWCIATLFFPSIWEFGTTARKPLQLTIG